ncbi:MAG: hypothetical protein ACYC5A_00965 [Thermoleophilia bacterium]
MDNTSGAGEYAAIPPEIDKWNWGAFIGGWYWAFIMDLPFEIQLRAGIPLLGNLMAGRRGYEWAWKHASWNDVNHLFETQRKRLWQIIALTLMAPSVLLLMVIMTYR